MEKVLENYSMTGQANLEDEENEYEDMDCDENENVKYFL